MNFLDQRVDAAGLTEKKAQKKKKKKKIAVSLSNKDRALSSFSLSCLSALTSISVTLSLLSERGVERVSTEQVSRKGGTEGKRGRNREGKNLEGVPAPTEYGCCIATAPGSIELMMGRDARGR